MKGLRSLSFLLVLFALPALGRAGAVAFSSGFESDRDGDGVADGWSGLVGSFRLAPGPRGLCQEAKVPKGGPRFAEVLRSRELPVEPGRMYRVRFLCKGRGLSIFHVKFRWLDGRGRTVKTISGKNYEQLLSPVRNAPQQKWWDAKGAGGWLPSNERSGDWDWEEWAGFYTAPEGARLARIEFWAERKGGAFWVDGVEVRQVEPEEFSPRPLTLGRADFTIRPERRGSALILPGPVRVELLFAPDGSFLGLGRVVVRGRTVRLGGMPLAPLFFGKEPLTYRGCRLLSVRRVGRGFLLRTALLAPDGTRDLLEWDLRPERARVGGALAVGFSLALRFSSERREAHEVLLRASWCLGGDVDGLLVPQQFPVPPEAAPQIVKLTKQTSVRFAPWPRVRIGAGDWFTLLQADGCSLLLFPCGIALSRYRLSKVPPMREVAHEEGFVFPLSRRVETPRLYVLALEGSGPGAWADAYDWTAGKLREKAGMREQEPLPAVNFSAPFVVPPEVHPLWPKLLWPCREGWRWRDSFDWAEREALPAAERLGFRRLFIHSIWTSQATEWRRLTEEGRRKVKLPSACGPITLDVAEVYGGVEGLRRLCREAKKRAIEVVAWFPTAHLSNISPLYISHPEWALVGKDGKPFTFGYVDITGMWHPAGFGEYALRKLRAAREAGLGGLWLDSYPVFGTGRVNYATPKWEPHLPYIVEFQRELQRMGYTMLLEGSGPLGIPSFGIGRREILDRYLEAPWLLYKTSPLLPWHFFPWQRNFYLLPEGAYFRLLAVKCCPIVTPEQWWGRPKVEAEMRYANGAYVRLLPIMRRMRPLPGGAGVLWEGERGRAALFAFRRGWVDIGRPVISAMEAVERRPAKFEGSKVWAEALKAYEICVEGG